MRHVLSIAQAMPCLKNACIFYGVYFLHPFCTRFFTEKMRY